MAEVNYHFSLKTAMATKFKANSKLSLPMLIELCFHVGKWRVMALVVGFLLKMVTRAG